MNMWVARQNKPASLIMFSMKYYFSSSNTLFIKLNYDIHQGYLYVLYLLKANTLKLYNGYAVKYEK